jgi:hypothetical protein
MQSRRKRARGAALAAIASVVLAVGNVMVVSPASAASFPCVRHWWLTSNNYWVVNECNRNMGVKVDWTWSNDRCVTMTPDSGLASRRPHRYSDLRGVIVRYSC